MPLLPIMNMNKYEKVIKILNYTLGSPDDNGTMLKAGLHAYDRLSKYISHLSATDQANIVHEATMIAYDARISAFNHIIKGYDTEGDGCDSKKLAGGFELSVSGLPDGIEGWNGTNL